MSKIIITFLFLASVFLPMRIYAQYIGSDNPRYTGENGFQLVPCGINDKRVVVPCDFNALMVLLNRFMNFILYMSIPLAAISISYAGGLYIFAAGDTGKIESAHKIFWSVLKGFIFVLAGWLIVYSIMSALLGPNFMNSQSNLLRGVWGGSEGSVNMNNVGGNSGVDNRWTSDSKTNIGDFNGTTNTGDYAI